MAAACVAARVCETPGCNSEAKLQCPTCIKIGIPGSFFCSQDCFKGSWSEHKKLHKKNKENDEQNKGGFNPWPGFHFTGTLRPYSVTPKRQVPDTIGRPDYADHPEGVPLTERQLRGTTNIKILDDEEKEGMTVACRLGREVLDEAAKAVEVGITTDEIDLIAHEACIDRECYPSPLNYYGFPKSCCTSVNEHCLSPWTRSHETFCWVQLMKIARNWEGSLQHAIEEVKPGVRYREIGNVIQKHAQAHGYSVVRSYCGHGIHQLFHTAPSVPHYAKNKAVGVMKPGHCFTIEPMISEGTWRDEMWPDNWTAVTQDGRRSAQFEHTLLVTETGCDVLTRRLDKDGQSHFMDKM
ncbi:LOW QUALITY PROTEIN: methionine aminopeptidase 1-like [Haliotis rubra]|uniref:LOW QUALITY PROTEIN: methionine aminopeptidase 1-like n=1 Tax=Haliotis rubra TaxID=36100 RepID=UPI001EE50BCF|nr:LOW QUALITY PROTEIN: methionine aminopeptidase 1-like [Haliotis rubra]